MRIRVFAFVGLPMDDDWKYMNWLGRFQYRIQNILEEIRVEWFIFASRLVREDFVRESELVGAVVPERIDFLILIVYKVIQSIHPMENGKSRR